MRALLIVCLLAGCSFPTLNSSREPNRACSDHARTCGCPGMQGCTSCCTPEACACRDIAGR